MRGTTFAAALILVLALAVTGGCSGGGGRRDARGEPGRAAERAPEAPRPEAERERPLPGVLAVVVDNNPAAWPQAGLERADVVYEVPVEGGVTRYLAVFASRPVPRVGPVRSARPYLVELALAYGTPLVHAGGSQEAYEMLGRRGLRHLDEIRNAGELFARDRLRRAPHNLYTSSAALLRGMERRGWTAPSLPPPAERGPVGGGEEGAFVRIVYAQSRAFRYSTTYRWNGRRYVKEVDGRVAWAEAGVPLEADTVAVVVTRVRSTGDALGHVEVDVAGGGEAVVLRGGRAFRGLWRPGEGEPFVFEVDGAAFSRLPGTTWVNLVGSPAQVDLAPAGPGGREGLTADGAGQP